MTACLPLSDTLRINFEFPQVVPPPMNQFWQTPQQASYPKLFLVRECSGLGLPAGASLQPPRRPNYLDMSWDEYCSLVQSKPLALNIVSFRNQNISQSGENGRNQRTLSYYNRPFQVLLSNFVYQNTPLTSVNPVAASNMNSAAACVRNNASNYRQTQLDSSSIFPPRSSSSSSYYMNIPRISCGGSCCAQEEWRGGGGGGSGGGGGVAANSSHYQLSTQDPTTCHQMRQPIVTSSVSLTAQMSGNCQASGSDNLSTIAGGRSSTSSDVPNSSS